MPGTNRTLACSLAFFAVLALATSADAQPVPHGWRWQLDQPAPNVIGKDAPAGAWHFQEMVPGMHMTTGPGVVVYPPGPGARGRFMVDADLLLFPNSGANGYGVMFGGRSDGGADTTLRAWNAFLVNAAGKFAVVRHVGGKVEQLHPWTAHEAIVQRTSDVVTNRVRVWAERDSVRFAVNGKTVGAMGSASLEPDGLFGLRLEEGINMHITNVDHSVRLLKAK